jgi:hypothetical protein
MKISHNIYRFASHLLAFKRNSTKGELRNDSREQNLREIRRLGRIRLVKALEIWYLLRTRIANLEIRPYLDLMSFSY